MANTYFRTAISGREIKSASTPSREPAGTRFREWASTHTGDPASTHSGTVVSTSSDQSAITYQASAANTHSSGDSGKNSSSNACVRGLDSHDTYNVPRYAAYSPDNLQYNPFMKMIERSNYYQYVKDLDTAAEKLEQEMTNRQNDVQVFEWTVQHCHL